MDISTFVRRRPGPEKVALLVGSELSGLAPGTLSMADVCVRIPMRPGVDSLNLATAAGIAMYALASVIP
jgi:tRNA G18 (ribose-2'-O)-methylase SpoU